MSIRVHTFDPVEASAHVVHTYANGRTVAVQLDGTLLVKPKEHPNNPTNVLGAYAAGKWSAAYDEAEMVAQPEQK